jgi:FkbM family methyltransferase
MKLKTKIGVSMEVFPGDYIDNVILNEGFYESEVLEALLDNVPADCVFWDIGANIGTHSLGFKYLRPDATVISFEPDAINFHRLKQHCILNDLDIQLMNFPLSDKLELTKIFSAHGNHGRSTLAPGGKGGYKDHPNYVFGISADFLVMNGFLPSPHVVKLDVEGYELNVIKGMCGILKEGKTEKIVFEAIHSFLDEDSELKQILTGFQYKFRKLIRNEKTHHNLDNFEAYL